MVHGDHKAICWVLALLKMKWLRCFAYAWKRFVHIYQFFFLRKTKKNPQIDRPIILIHTCTLHIHAKEPNTFVGMWAECKNSVDQIHICMHTHIHWFTREALKCRHNTCAHAHQLENNGATTKMTMKKWKRWLLEEEKANE